MEEYYLSDSDIEANYNEKSLKNKEKGKKDPHISIIIFQGTICLILIVAVLLIRLFFGEFFEEINEWYKDNINTDTNINQVLYGNETGSGGPLEVQTTLNSVSFESSFFMPLKGTLTSPFGFRKDPFTGQTAFHNGIDIAAPEGSSVYSALSGSVEKVCFDDVDYGNYLILNHGGIKTLYAHCSKINVKEGDTVFAKTKIALCGSTGRSTGPHLHFEIRVGSNRIDPAPFLNFAENQ